MLSISRQQKILEKLYSQKTVDVEQLSVEFQVSKITIRRDLQKFHDEGIVSKTYGGAVLLETSKEVPILFREISNVEEKKLICNSASELVKDGDTIILFYSTTTMPLIPLLGNFSRLTVITNSPNAVLALNKYPSIKVLCTGGELKRGSMTYIGSAACSMFQNYYADMLFFSASGFSLERGLTDTSVTNSEMIKYAMESAKNVTFLADESKFNSISLYHINPISTVNTVITNAFPGDDWKKTLDSEQIKLIY